MLPHVELMRGFQTIFDSATSPGSAVYNMVSGNIFGHISPVDTPTPYVVWSVFNGNNDYMFGGILADVIVRFNIYDHSNSNQTVLQIGSALEVLLDKNTFTLGNSCEHVCNNYVSMIGPFYPDKNEIQATLTFENKVSYPR